MKLKMKIHCFVVLTVILLLFTCRCNAEKEEVIFFDEKNFEGNKLFISLAPGCYSMDRDWDDRIQSVDTQGHCIIAYEFKECHGDSVKIFPGHEGAEDLRKIRFNHEISSIKKCVEGRITSSKKDREANANGLDIWKVGIEEHNKYRKMHGVQNLRGSVELHEEAQGHADYLAKNNRFEVSTGTEYGENLATSYKKDKLDAIRDVVKRWYDKIEFFNFRDPESNKNNPKTGQFSSLVWKATTHLGVGVSWNEKDEKWVIVCMYSPPATTSRYTENVPPPVKGMHVEAPSVYRTRDVMGNFFNPSRHRYQVFTSDW